MKRTAVFTFCFLLTYTSSALALDWDPFVAWKGKVYEVKWEEVLNESQIGNVIGKVKTKANEYTGKYYGDASNYYAKGTEYYEIVGTPSSEAIAVKDGDVWVKAVYVQKAPVNMMNIFTSVYFYIVITIIILIIAWNVFRGWSTKA